MKQITKKAISFLLLATFLVVGLTVSNFALAGGYGYGGHGGSCGGGCGGGYGGGHGSIFSAIFSFIFSFVSKIFCFW